MHSPHTDPARRSRLRRLREAALARHVVARLPIGFTGRWTHRDWAHASLLGCMGVLVATIAPGMDAAMRPDMKMHAPRAASISIPLPLPRTATASEATPHWQVVNVRKGQTLSGLFAAMGVSPAGLQVLLKHPGARADLTHLSPGTELAIDAKPDGTLQGLRFPRDQGKVQLTLDGGKVTEQLVPQDVDTRTVVLSGTVGRDLRASARSAGLTRQNFEEMTDEIFKYDIDFESDLHADDRFSVVVDQTWKDGQLVDTSPVLAAAFTVDGETHTGFRYTRDGKPEYFTADGRSLKRPFIRMPIPYARLTSGFGNRMHPILGRMRMHKGLDYAAPIGTPIMAAGDARVKSVGQVHGYGNTVELDHGHGQTTFYAHMSRYAHIHAGERIPQGTVIGYVGSTGMSTGPHLHYEFRINGVYRNPLTVTMAPPEPLNGAALADFRGETRRAMAKIRTVEKIIYPDMTRVAAIDAKQTKKG